MKLVGKLLGYVWLSCLAVTVITGCTDPNRVIDENISITNHNWSYGNKVKFNVDIEDPSTIYNLYLNIRVTSNYKYSNMFVLVYQSGGSVKKAVATRYELKLASPTGEWLGKGSGSMYSYQIPFKTNYSFPAKSKYRFEIEQNMRDNPLHSVSDVGLRVEKAK
ncbi:gliding motility lipoprotein GldH [Mucilaginibacter terrae]|uniref:gliding motility lipoprotein GldH n=1 Tax=Mucilaginibacter terrae TaxID=1955052 RepID=UPI0036411D9B